MKNVSVLSRVVVDSDHRTMRAECKIKKIKCEGSNATRKPPRKFTDMREIVVSIKHVPNS